jgi:TIR domain
MAAVFFAGVLNLYDVLRAHGHEVFLDQCVLKAGDPLIKNLEAGLTSSQTGVLVWSSATADSDWVFREYSTMEARTTKKPGFQFVPVRLDASELPSFATIESSSISAPIRTDPMAANSCACCMPWWVSR